MTDLAKSIQPDVIVLCQDSWNVAYLSEVMAMKNIWSPTVGYVAVDSENVRRDVADQLKNLRLAICHTKFGVEQIRRAGYNGKVSVIPHGVSTEIYQPMSRGECREFGGLKETIPDSAFMFGCVNANNPRKRLDLVIAYFAAWWEQAGHPLNAYLYLHADTGAWDIGQISEYCGVHGRVIRSKLGVELDEGQMAMLYNFFDAQLSCAEGESWGLTTLEGMACGIPQIAVHCAGLADWAGDAIQWVEPTIYGFSPNFSNSRRRIAPEGPYVKAMHALYTNKELREDYGRRGIETAKRFSWDAAAALFDKELRGVVTAQRKAVPKEEACIAEFS